MVLHPRVLRKIQNEMDTVLGNKRLPTVEDREALPYFDCVLKEVLRCVIAAGLSYCLIPVESVGIRSYRWVCRIV